MARQSATDPLLSYEFEADESPSAAVVNAVAAASDTPVWELEPLGYAIDTDALDAFVECDGPARLTVEYCGFEATVQSDEVVVREATDGERADDDGS